MGRVSSLLLWFFLLAVGSEIAQKSFLIPVNTGHQYRFCMILCSFLWPCLRALRDGYTMAPQFSTTGGSLYALAGGRDRWCGSGIETPTVRAQLVFQVFQDDLFVTFFHCTFDFDVCLPEGPEGYKSHFLPPKKLGHRMSWQQRWTPTQFWVCHGSIPIRNGWLGCKKGYQ